MKPETVNTTELCRIMANFGSDKSSLIAHFYTEVYYKFFSPIRNNNLRIFEMGITYRVQGASLYGWRQFFLNAQIFGGDIDRAKLFESDRIKTFYCNQKIKESIENLWRNPELSENFDIIIDDGNHALEANICLLENSIHKLKTNGYYFIEDIADIEGMKTAINKWNDIFPNITFELICNPYVKMKNDNLLVAINKSPETPVL